MAPDTADLPSDLPAATEEVAEALVSVWDRALGTLGTHVSRSQLRVLLIVSRHDSTLNINGLAERLGSIPSSASRLCDRLESNGLISRTASPHDRREVTVSLSAAGERLLAELSKRKRENIGAIMDRMAPTDQIALLRGLRAFHDAAHASGLYDGTLAR